MALRITKRGLKAIAVEDDQGDQQATEDEPATPEDASEESIAAARGGQTRFKQALIIELLQRPEGATIAAVMAATSWQQHSVRGFFAGAVRKKLGLTLVSDKIGDQRVCRIVPPDAPKPAARKSKRQPSRVLPTCRRPRGRAAACQASCGTRCP